jgi:phenylacetate-CoA ligase
MSPAVDLSPSAALAALLEHSAAFSPYYSEQPWAARLRRGATVEVFRDIPPTDKDIVRRDATAFYSRQVSPEDGKTGFIFTSGSTGEPMKIMTTQLHQRINVSENVRLRQGWRLHEHRNGLELCWIEKDKPSGQVDVVPLENGGRLWKLCGLEATAALDLLRRSSATYVSGFPSLVHEALRLCRAANVQLPLRLIATFGEVVSAEFREFARAHFDCPILDRYGSYETSVIAIQCAYCGDYHIADRHLLFEVLDDDGMPAAPGEIGRVAVTPLYNRAMPLLRYLLGDVVELGRENSCRQSKVSIRRIVGREKNMFKLVDGRRIAPMIPAEEMAELGLAYFKLVQTSLQDVELHYVPRDATVRLSEEAAQEVVDRNLSPLLRARPVALSAIPRSPGGKLLMHESFV